MVIAVATSAASEMVEVGKLPRANCEGAEAESHKRTVAHTVPSAQPTAGVDSTLNTKNRMTRPTRTRTKRMSLVANSQNESLRTSTAS